MEYKNLEGFYQNLIENKIREISLAILLFRG